MTVGVNSISNLILVTSEFMSCDSRSLSTSAFSISIRLLAIMSTSSYSMTFCVGICL